MEYNKLCETCVHKKECGQPKEVKIIKCKDYRKVRGTKSINK